MKTTNRLLLLLLFLSAIGFMGKTSLFIFLAFAVLLFLNQSTVRYLSNSYSVILLTFCILFYFFCLQTSYTSGLRIFCCLFSYAIGCYFATKDEKTIQFVLLFIVFSNCLYVIVNFAFEYLTYGSGMLATYQHYSFWDNSQISTTGIMTNTTLLVSSFYYCLLVCKKMAFKVLYLVFFVCAIIYDIILGGRSIVIIFAICLFGSFVYSLINNNRYSKKSRRGFLILVTFSLVLGVFAIIRYSDFFSSFFLKTNLYKRIEYSNFFSLSKDGRWSIRSKYYNLFPQHLFGGSYIQRIVGQQPHELWLEIFDLGGILPYLLLILLTAYSVFLFFTYIKQRNHGFQTKLLVASLFLGLILQMAIEPVYTGAPFLLYVFFMIIAICQFNSHEYRFTERRNRV